MQTPKGKRAGSGGSTWLAVAALPWVGVAILATALAAVLLTVAPSIFAAEAPPKFWKKCTTGAGAGQCSVPRGIATDPGTGHLYVADQVNRRVVELTAWGEFIKAWGKGVKDGSPVLQVCTTESGCLAGQLGSGKGEFNGTQGVAVDSAGDVYVVDRNNHRVQKFSPDGEFVLMLGANVNKTKVDESAPPAQRNICTEASGDVCQAGATGNGDGEFSTWPISSFIAADPPGSGTKIYVGDEGRVQEFEPNGSFIKELPLPSAAEVVKSLAVEATGNLYLALEGKNEVRKLDASGAELCKTATPLTNPVALALNPEGGFYAVAGTGPFAAHQFGSSCPLTETGPSFGADELTEFSTGIATGATCFTSGFGLYLPSSGVGGANSFIRAYGPVPNPGLCPRPPEPPSITSQQVVAAQHEPPSTTVEAEINPHFWDDATYYVEYGTGKCSEGGCDKEAPLTPAPLGGGITDEDVATAGVVLSNLQLGTTYHYRFVAQSGGGPVYGGDPDGDGPEEATEEAGTERYFRTIDPPLPGCPPGCLPDNRAYEQVSPTAKGNFDIDRGPVIARPDGEAVLYGSLGAFADPNAGAFTSMYTAHRSPGSWSSEALGPTADPVQEIANGQVLGVSGDLNKQLVLTNAKLTPEAEEGKNEAVNIYVHDSATGSYQYVDTAFGAGALPQQDVLLYDGFAGASDDGSSFYFVLTKPLDTVPAPPAVGESGGLLYGFDTTTGELSYLGVLPGGGVDPVGSFGAGAISEPVQSNGSVAFDAVSEDGKRVYWTHRSEQAPLYLYEGGQSTLVSEREADSSTQKARLWGASADGALALLTSADQLTEDASPAGADLYRYDAGADQLSDLTAGKTLAGGVGVQKVLEVSEDGAYAYFVATWSSGGQAGIYAWHEGDGIRTIGVLASQETQFTLAETPNDFWRISPNGHYLAFLFGGEIVGPDPQQSYPVRQAYLYDYGADSLACASCPPEGLASAEVTLHGSRTTGNNFSSLFPYEEGVTRNLTNAGQLFFQSKDRLLLADVNGAQDVYQYSAAEGKVHLISTGQSSSDSFFGDATLSGSDVFFTTRERLVFQDQDGLADLYDARVNGGIAAQNQPPPVPCDPNVNCGGPITQPPAGPSPSHIIGPPDPVPPKCKAGFLRKGNKCVKAGHGKKAKKHRRHRARHKRGRR